MPINQGLAEMPSFQRAIESCKTTGYDPDHHFRGVTKMVPIGSGAGRPIDDFMLTRYACYLIAQNGDPRKEPIAFAQSYFAVQTRKQELIEERMNLLRRMEAREKLRASEKTLSDNIYERGVDDAGFGRIRSKGDAALFGGHTTKAMRLDWSDVIADLSVETSWPSRLICSASRRFAHCMLGRA
jgi:DNA-damage-inducible protein D